MAYLGDAYALTPMPMIKYHKLLALPFVLTGLTLTAQLIVEPTLDHDHMVQDVLVGDGVTAFNVSYYQGEGWTSSGEEVCMGEFSNGDSTNLGMAAGVVLSTGRADEVDRPASYWASWTINGHGDPDLNSMGWGNMQTMDATVLEFDLIPDGDSLWLRFLFASEEYYYSICSNYPDMMGLFLSGPGIEGPFSNNAINMAVVPGGQVPININTVNSGVLGPTSVAGNCGMFDPDWLDNIIYYVDNTEGEHISFDGFTTVLTARAAVEPGELHHLKIVVADMNDRDYDSAIFLEAGSLVSGGSWPMGNPGSPTATSVQLMAYPNPASRSVVLQASTLLGARSMEIWDMRGNILWSGQWPSGKREYHMPLDGFAAGQYVCRVIGTDHAAVAKLVVE